MPDLTLGLQTSEAEIAYAVEAQAVQVGPEMASFFDELERAAPVDEGRGLTHDEAAEAEVVQFIDGLREHLMPEVFPAVSHALHAENVALAKSGWPANARDALRGLPGSPTADWAERPPLPGPDEDEARAHAGGLLDTLLVTWLEAVRQAVRRSGEVLLDTSLMPLSQQVSPSIRDAIGSAIAPYALEEGGERRILMQAFHVLSERTRRAGNKRHVTHLPFAMELRWPEGPRPSRVTVVGNPSR